MKISGNRNTSRFVSTIDLDYALGQMELHKDTAKHRFAAIVGGKTTGHYCFKKRFYGLAEMPVAFQTKIDKALKYQTPAWQDDIIVVTRGTAVDHEVELAQILSKLEEHGYKASERKSKMFQHSTEWFGYIE